MRTCRIALLTRSPVLHVGKVGRGGNLAVVCDVDSTAAEEGNGQASGSTDRLLTSSDDTIQAPVVKGKLLAGDTADTVGNDEGIGRDLLDRLDEGLEVEQDTGRGVDMGGGDKLVLLLGEGLFNLGGGGDAANGTVELGHLGAVLGQAVGEAVTKVAGAEDKYILAGLDQVGGDEIPAERARAVDDVWLSVWVGRADDFAEQRQGLAKDLDEASTDVALTKSDKKNSWLEAWL